MAAPSRVRYSLLPSRPISEPQSIRNLMRDIGEEIDLHPVYQREIKWKLENMCSLIETIMMEGLIPGFILYRLQGDDERKKESHRFECVDGQHRFFTIAHYFKGEPVAELPRSPMITWIYRDEASKKDIHVFYQKNKHTEAWEAEHRGLHVAYMTPEERDHFNDFKLDVRVIRDPLSLDQRRGIFTALQKGVPVRNSDLYKNYTHIPLVRYIVEEQGWESLKKQMIERLTVEPKAYWLHWIIRAWLMLNPPLDKGEDDMFVVSDSQITKWLQKEHPIVADSISEEQKEEFAEAINRFFEFLSTLPNTVKLSPFHFYALFWHLAYAPGDREEILHGHIAKWAINKEQKDAWRSREKERDPERMATFMVENWEALESIEVAALSPTARTKIPKVLREAVWRNAFGEAVVATCPCCRKEEISLEKNYEACHVVAHARGGADTEDNLRPGCRSCNRSMGMQNYDEYKAQFYPV